LNGGTIDRVLNVCNQEGESLIPDWGGTAVQKPWASYLHLCASVTSLATFSRMGLKNFRLLCSWTYSHLCWM